MNQNIVQKLKEWRVRKGREENIELYVILHNKTIEAIAEALPINKEEFVAVKGFGEKKYDKYGKEIIAIIKECSGKESETTKIIDGEKVYSVSDFLNLINSNLSDFQATIRGEVSSVNKKGHVYFSLKDKDDESVINCLIWESNYQLAGINLEIGMEIIAHGIPEVYKSRGQFTFKAQAIELVGEGSLKKAYDILKKKLALEGLFDEERKKPLPNLPFKIGLITSKDGAVIHDFQSNLGRFGYKITFVDARVEGVMAVKDLISAVRYFKEKSIDVLVIIRGGGSLESLQSFNNEVLIREIVDFPVPIICGIGHDKDIPLFSLVADMAVSTPTAVTREINRSWEETVVKINQYKSNILSQFQMILNNNRYLIDQYFSQIKHYYQKILKIFESFNQIIKRVLNSFTYVLKYKKEKIDNIVKSLEQNNPERQLKLGYSIMFSGGKVIKSISQVKKDDLLNSKLNDGEVLSTINKINKRE